MNTNTIHNLNFFRVTLGAGVRIVGCSDSFIDTTGFNQNQTEAAEEINRELESRCSMIAFGEVGGKVRPATQRKVVKLPKLRFPSPVGANDVKQAVRNYFGPQHRLTVPAQRRAVNNLRNNPEWTTVDAASEAIGHFEDLLTREEIQDRAAV